MLDGQRLSLARDGPGLARITFHNPPHGFMDGDTERELAAALDAIDADAALAVVLLTGAQPGVFIRHYDVSVLEARARAMAARALTFATDRPVPESPIHKCLARIEASPRIFIAALNGTTMGGGYELALACDLRYAERGAYRIGLPESNLGLLPGAGGTQRLPALVGAGRALEWLLLGRTFSPDEAAAEGLVHACVDAPVLEHARAVARRLVDRPQRALGHIKRLVRGAQHLPRAQGFADERTLFCDLMVNPETTEQMRRMNAGERGITGED